MINNSTLPLKKICLDCVMLTCVGLSIMLIKKLNIIFQRGFFCNDEDLLHPFANSIINKKYFTGFATSLNCIVIILTEFLRRTKYEEGLTFWRFKIPLWCYKAYQMLLAFGFGLLCAMVTVTLSKSITGRLRPHFLTVCAPDINCSLAENQHIYHINFNCTRNLDKPGILKNARLSFPSGHANFFMYCAVFFSIYLQKKMVWDGPKLFKSTIQFLSILSAFCIGLSRISNNFHHWTDVTAGFAIGGAYAVCANLKVLRTEASIDAASTNL